MIVLDASAVAEMLVKHPLGPQAEEDLAVRDDPSIVADLLDVEVLAPCGEWWLADESKLILWTNS